jgi:hypothetical protein
VTGSIVRITGSKRCVTRQMATRRFNSDVWSLPHFTFGKIAGRFGGTSTLLPVNFLADCPMHATMTRSSYG